ncbi:MAG: NADH-quinone oxidoreductase subunit NuoN [Gammaproteobacteria bacterium]|nr:NADH-quinone oxidoreductase subunit NuoN [Gammaproteobacteria bacterium]
MNALLIELPLAWPELALLLLGSVLLVVDTMVPGESRRATCLLAQVALVIVTVLVVAGAPAETNLAFSGHFVSDPMAAALKVAILLVSVMAFSYAADYFDEHGFFRGEFYILGLFAVLGMMVLISAHSLLTVYLGLELLSLSLYSMVALHRDSPSASEAAMKYFVLGALASGMLLYGMSMLYGMTGTLELSALSRAVADLGGNNIVLVFGLVFIVVGTAFKLGLVPFHMWVPDVYEGSPTAVTLFVSSAPKIAAFAMAMRLLVDGLWPMFPAWEGMLIVLSVLSMAAGNVIAISQSNIKRMLAYSTIAHVGFLVLGILSGTATGYAGAMFYAIVYAFMSLGSFGMVMLLSRRQWEHDRLDDFQGLARRSPWFALMMLILMFSMAGVPPFAGFWAKWFVIKEVIAAGHAWLAAVAVVFSVVGAYYYLRIIKLMYFDEPVAMAAPRAAPGVRILLSANALALFVVGVLPGALMALCIRAVGM